MGYAIDYRLAYQEQNDFGNLRIRGVAKMHLDGRCDDAKDQPLQRSICSGRDGEGSHAALAVRELDEAGTGRLVVSGC